jgi:hypothetical protein
MAKKIFSSWLLALGCLTVVSLAVAAEPSPSGTVKIASKAVAIGVGVTWGDGTLSYQGKNYTFSVDGISVVDLGASDVTSVGEVFYLNKLEDFSGNYTAGEAGIAIGGGPSDTIMKNPNGVVIRLHGTQKGGRLTLAGQGVTLQLKK